MGNRSEYMKEYKRTHKEQIRLYNEKTREHQILKSREYYKQHKEKMNQMAREYYIKNKSIMKKQAKEYYYKNKEKALLNVRKYRKINKPYISEYKKRYFKENKYYIYRQRAKRLNKDISFRIGARLRSRISTVLKNNFKSDTTIKLLGCSIEELKIHLKKQFKPGMKWKNYGEWHIDHIIPCCQFDLSKSSEQRKCFHYTNLQPLWAEDNLSKGGKYDG